MTLRQIAERLAEAGIEGALHEALLLAEGFTGRSYSSLRAAVDEEFTMSDEFSEAVGKRCSRYPLQYILGEWEFMGLPFAVNENCLIPRSDTEILCEYIIENAPKNGRILDLCTGSGCIIAAVLHYREDMTGAAVELYPETMGQAEENFRRLGLSERVQTILGDASVDLLSEGEGYDVISANPPYVTAEEMLRLEPELFAEPPHALTDGGDGLSLIRAIIDSYTPHLSADGFMIIEHGAAQSDAVIGYAKERGLSAEPLEDYGGNTRAAVIRRIK
ncbi:MAG: peptide chain release factor N(5)-glutamine methyltransferase [Ruminococcaceae bacterium]|nr:peptide chain release factor N(5)-glutamine methyltransferase [Oscillospiraceae bacterium]